MASSNAERQARWRERRAARAEKFDNYQRLIGRIEELRAEVQRRSEEAQTLPAYQRLVGWIDYELGAMVPRARKCRDCGYVHRPCDDCGRDHPSVT